MKFESKMTKRGEKHGCLTTYPNFVATQKFEKDSVKNDIEKMAKEDRKIVKAEYVNTRSSSERLTKPYLKYAGDEITYWHFIPGEVYEVPMGLVKEVNESPGEIQRSQVLDKNGLPTQKDINLKVHKFVPVGF